MANDKATFNSRTRQRAGAGALLAMAALCLLCSAPQSVAAEALPRLERYVPRTLPSGARVPTRLSDKEDRQWPMPAKNFASTRYSGLNQITTSNAKQLRLAWTFSTGQTNGHEAAPVVVDQVMYVVTPFPNVVYALDLSKPGGAKKCESITMAPLVVNGKMLVGNSGGEMGVRGWLKAIDIDNGKLLWTVHGLSRH